MENGNYIAARRARFCTAGGPVNIPWGTQVEAVDGFLYLEGRGLCAVTSQNAHDYFARNDDGNGPERGKLSAAIVAKLSAKDAGHAKRWEKVWEDPTCRKYKRVDYSDYWLWNHEFFEAPLEDLQYIAGLVGARPGVK